MPTPSPDATVTTPLPVTTVSLSGPEAVALSILDQLGLKPGRAAIPGMAVLAALAREVARTDVEEAIGQGRQLTYLLNHGWSVDQLRKVIREAKS